MRNGWLLLFGCLFFSFRLKAQDTGIREIRKNIPLDSITLSDPFILADQKTNMYYMTGTGGMLWKSKDLKSWDGPYRVTATNPDSWMGPRPMIWAAEIHAYKNRYYYFATFTNRLIKIDSVKGRVIDRRASHLLVSDKPDGPYAPVNDSITFPLTSLHWMELSGLIKMANLI